MMRPWRCGWRSPWRRGGNAGPVAGQYSLLRQAAGGAETGKPQVVRRAVLARLDGQFLADPAGALGHFTAVRDAIGDRGHPGRWLMPCPACGGLAADGPDRRGGAMPTARWPWPGRSGTRPWNWWP